MNEKQSSALLLRDTDVQGVLRRFNENEQLYVDCLHMFLNDPTMEQLIMAIEARSWDDAFTAAHALKGLAGNLGFIPLMHAIGQLIILIRGGRISEVDDFMLQVNSHYRDIVDAIQENF